MPCTEDHTAEVFYASNTHWAKQGGFPGDANQERRHRRV